ncbi:MAG: hypothetical protein KME60_13555 [Cyanomargarita calcarea GSE-NOS-MK-12-04C]|jgi:prophage antirepressor-like protein|uniref:Bro-N domain-containing protein n=1 Tax=Cyanomargarita calcarea GSE-NOS-MK-12-04C TaxID=2839659 RepID=A0A951UV09_9CYAN|nr:hypothetical protein [Cyanomargarita calcarea GSE-NOS-MK-12-04C]
MSDLTVFQFESKEVRFVGTPIDPWWVAADVCGVLEHSNPSSAIARLDEDEKKLLDPKQYLGSASNQDFWAINQSGLYSLVLTSRKAQAKRFKKWLTSEVIPSIVRTGKYELPQAEQQPQAQVISASTEQPALPPAPPTPSEISEVLSLIFQNTDINPNLIAGVKANAIAKQHPQYTAVIEAAKSALAVPVEDELLSPTQLAQILSDCGETSWSARSVNKLLLQQGLQTRNPDSDNPAYLPTPKGKQYCHIFFLPARNMLNQIPGHPA